MNCSKTEELRKYLAGDLTTEAARLLEQHVEACMLCQKVMMEEADSDEEYQVLQVPSALPADFTDQVMTALETVRTPTPKPNWKKRSVNILKKTAIAVASVTAIITFGSMVSPTFASYVNSVIQSIQGIDTGMKQAAEKGYAQAINKSATDQGITLNVKEVVADPVRMAIFAQVVDQNGKRIPFDPGKIDVNLTYKTKSGEELNPDGGGYSYGEEGEYLVISHDIFQFLKESKTQLDEMVVGVDATMLDGKEGNWKMEFPVDLKKARAAANETTIGKDFMTPHGIKVALQNIKTVPSVSLIELETTWTEERAKQVQKIKEENGWVVKEDVEDVPGVWTDAELVERYFIDIGLAYEIVDEKGKVVAGWDDFIFGDHLNQIRKNTVASYRGQLHDEGKRYTKFNGISPLADDQTYTFKLHSLYLFEPAKFQATIPVDKLMKEKVTVTNNDSVYTFTGFTLKTTEGEEKIGDHTYSGKGAIIPFTAVLPEGIIGNQVWSAQDDAKQDYRLLMKETFKRDKDGRVHVSGTFFIRDLEKQPKELSLKHLMQWRQYQGMNWEVPFKTSSKR
ncbi:MULTISPECIES: DUF4179 domain-containing protein [Bacillales]|uniref:DUF4179 domain-containing protein n=1 Tax=Bacillales TaxID=1385 RepID=UPI00034A5BBE|nr:MULTISPECIES: DUF4179 domain-containing protein [Bacillales]KMZ41367.1 hypothetical protein AC624_09820 [Bacillus sp. FJAT-27238]